MHILIADDEEDYRNMIRELLTTDPNTQLTIASDGAQAWWALTDPQQRFDLAIVDLKMPHVDGLALIARIRASTQLRHLPVILCTGMSDRETVAKAARLNLNSYVVKPFQPQALRDKVATFAPRYGQRPERTLLS